MNVDKNKTVLTPENGGENCLGNGKHYDENGSLIECCCDECDYFLICWQEEMRL